MNNRMYFTCVLVSGNLVIKQQMGGPPDQLHMENLIYKIIFFYFKIDIKYVRRNI